MTERELEQVVLDELRVALPRMEVLARTPVSYAAGAERDHEFKVDILVREVPPGALDPIPRVAVELKSNGISTHDLLTYSSKARLHRSSHGYLRYGVFVAGEGGRGVTAKWLWHGQEFDFMLCCRSSIPEQQELQELTKIVKAEVKTSRLMEKWRTQIRGPWPRLLWKRTEVR